MIISTTLMTVLFGFVLPVVAIALGIFKKIREDRNRKDIIIAAIEKNPDVDIEEITKKLDKSDREREPKPNKLMAGITVTLIGLTFTLNFLWAHGNTFARCSEELCFAGLIMVSVGIAQLVAYFVSVKNGSRQ